MTAEAKINHPPRRPILLSPWLVVLGGLLLYGLTLNHWVSLKSLPLMAQVLGWDWHPYSLPWRLEPMAPLFLVLTSPVRLLPAGWQPAALNVFTAVCAALTLGLLARSVRLLPHDRTREQRLRELGAHALLSLRSAFLPVLFAVLVLATQLTFWQNAVSATGEMLDVLVFAFLINCLLEFRVSQNENWLLVSGFVYGLGLTNNWALLGFFPLFVVAVLWVKGLAGFFNPSFLVRMWACGLAGLPLYLLIPILGGGHGGQEDFWALLRQEVGTQIFSVRFSVPHWLALVAAVPTIMPLVFAAIRWPSFEGEVSPAGNILTRLMFSLLHVAFLVLALVTFFDFKFSPSVRIREQPVSFLTFYYAGALCVGYFSGYVLLVFGVSKLQPWERQLPLTTFLRGAMVVAVWMLCLAAPVALAWETYPRIRAGNSQVLQQFAQLTLDGLPAKKTIVLSDDAARLYLLQAECEHRGLVNRHILIDTESFAHREYIMHLVSQYPELKSVVTTNLARLPRVLASENLVKFMYQVTRNYPVYYLHPSFGYYFEALYLKPRGLVYELKPYTTNLTQPPLPTDAEIKANQAYWTSLENGPLKPLPELAKLDEDAAAVSVDYAVALDFWGTELQKANRLQEAHQQFAEAVRLNAYNFIAAINLAYNERLQKGDRRPIDSTDDLEKAMYLYHGLVPVLRRNGPADEPGLDLALGQVMAVGGNLSQASILFQRRLQWLPGDPEALLAMAKTYTDLRQPAKAFALLHKLQNSSHITPWELARCEASAYMVEGQNATAEKVLRNAVRADPNDENRVGTLADFYRVQGLSYLGQHKDAQAVRAFTNALTNIDLQLKLLVSPRHDAAPTFDIAETLLNKAELEIKLRSYTDAVSTLTQFLQLQPTSYIALLNRGVSEIQLKQFKAARDDFKTIGKLLPEQPYVSEFGLADVAAAEKNEAEEIDHLKRCISSAPEETSEYRRATNRLAVLERH